MTLPRHLLRRLPFALRVEIEENAQRKNLTQTELAREQARIRTHLEKVHSPGRPTKEEIMENVPQFEGTTRDIIGGIYGESGKTVDKRQAVVQAAQSEPEKYGDLTVKMDMSGKVDGAYRELEKRMKQKALVIKAQEGATIPDYPEWQTHTGLFYPIMREMPPASIDVIITDPPYEKEFLPQFEDMAYAAKHVLKPGGSMFVMMGQAYLPEVYRLLSLHMKYHWTIAYLTAGQSTQIWQRKVMPAWKPVLWYVNGDYIGEWVTDVCKSNANDKDFHEWGQSESGMSDIVERFSRRDDVILDPCMGAGTTGVVAVRLGRRFIGIDKDEQHVNVARGRIGALYEPAN